MMIIVILVNDCTCKYIISKRTQGIIMIERQHKIEIQNNEGNL